MKLTSDAALERLTSFDHGTLCTAHPERGVDAVPALYALVDGLIGIPIDTVKPKSSPQLQRERNLESDPRATLLIEHWNRNDWSKLWWVRAELRWATDPADAQVEALGAKLESRFPQYDDQPFVRIITFRLEAVTGWAANEPWQPEYR